MRIFPHLSIVQKLAINVILFIQVKKKCMHFSNDYNKSVLQFKGEVLSLSSTPPHCDLPDDMKYGILNFPDTTIDLRVCKVLASKGRYPHTKTYSMTPRLWNEKNLYQIPVLYVTHIQKICMVIQNSIIN